MRKFIYLLFLLSVSCTNPLGDENPLDSSSEEPPQAFDFFMLQNVDQKLLISWSSSKGAKSYELNYGTATANYTSSMTVSKSPAVITGLSAGQTYYFRLKAINPHGDILSTSEKSFTHMGPPGAFSLVSAAASNGQVLLTWGASAQATNYVVKRGTAANAINTTVTTVATTSHAITGLTNGLTYYFQVTATNASGSLNSTNTLSATPDVAPTVPLNLKSKIEMGKCTIEWDPPASGSPPIRYTVRRVINPSVSNTICENISARTCEEDSLSNNSYTYTVESINATGTSPRESVTCNLAVPAAPTGVASNLATAYESAVIRWDGGAGAETFTLRYGTTAQVTEVASANATSPFTVTGLTNGTNYYFQVTAVNGYGEASATAIQFRPVGNRPTVSAITPVMAAMLPGMTRTRYFTIADTDPADILDCATSVIATSNNTLEIPNENISIGGSGTSCSITVTPKPGSSSSTTISVKSTDGVQESTVRTLTYFTLPSPERIYSLRRHNPNYNGPGVTVRRLSDGLTSDIGYDANGNLSVASYDSFLGGSTLYVTRLFDQGAQAAHITENDTNKQPQLFKVGTTLYIFPAGSPATQSLTVPAFSIAPSMTFYIRGRNVANVVEEYPIFSYRTDNSSDGISGFSFHRNLARLPEFKTANTSDPMNHIFDGTSVNTQMNVAELTMAAILTAGGKSTVVGNSKVDGALTGYTPTAPSAPFYLFAAEVEENMQHGRMYFKEFLYFNSVLTPTQIEALGTQN